jgi:hypothetical protein
MCPSHIQDRNSGMLKPQNYKHLITASFFGFLGTFEKSSIIFLDSTSFFDLLKQTEAVKRNDK